MCAAHSDKCKSTVSFLFQLLALVSQPTTLLNLFSLAALISDIFKKKKKTECTLSDQHCQSSEQSEVFSY